MLFSMRTKTGTVAECMVKVMAGFLVGWENRAC